ncbi:hypothetical protein FRC05_007684 [Tulasnella sp. 425]|nr:hypothetical protein FRC05_007684 [Tulasnella sp. 425]
MSNSADLWREFSWGTDTNEVPEDLRGASTADISLLPRAMKNLSIQLKRFLDNLHSIPEFSDEPLMDALLGFHEWLHYRAERIAFHLDSPSRRNLTVRQYIEQAMNEMSLQVSKMEAALSGFVEHGVTSIQNAQKKSQDRLQNMSTVATFLSAVTATTVQYPMSQEHLETAVMGLWISSLILSIASAINAQLAIHWRASMYRSPRNALPVFASICLDHTPLLCLVGSVLAFSAGLVVWTFAAKLALSVKISVGTITGVTFFVLIAAIIWEIMEWWRQDPTDTEEYLDAPESPSGTPVLEYPWRSWESAKDVGAEIRSRMLGGTLNVVATLRQSWRRLIRFITGNSNADPSQFILPQDNPNRKGDAIFPSIEGTRKNGIAGQELASTWSLTSISSDESDKSDTPEWEPMTPNSSGPLHGRRNGPLSPLQTTSPTRSKFQNAGRALMKDERTREIVAIQSQDRPEYCILRRNELQNLRPVLRLPIFHAPGHDIHFSPDGTRLAVSRLNQSLAIWEVGKYHEKPQTMPSPIGRFAWSPDGSHIVVIKEDGLNIWNKDSREQAQYE